MPLKILLSHAPLSLFHPQMQMELMSTDLVSELRAEVTRWWEMLQRQQQLRQNQPAQDASCASTRARVSLLSPVLGAILGDGPVRIITHGQELDVDVDEKTLNEVGIKDNQVKDSQCSLLYTSLFFCGLLFFWALNSDL